jgi:hypothetical protein
MLFLITLKNIILQKTKNRTRDNLLVTSMTMSTGSWATQLYTIVFLSMNAGTAFGRQDLEAKEGPEEVRELTGKSAVKKEEM